MINSCISRLILLPRTLNSFKGIHTSTVNSSAKAWVYRRGPMPAPDWIVRRANLMGTFMWYWMLYHIFTQYEHITGEFEYPRVAKWTDQELGIPPDSEE